MAEARKTAMKKEPSTPYANRYGVWKYDNNWVNKEGFKTDRFGKVIGQQAKPFVPTDKNPFTGKDKKPGTSSVTNKPSQAMINQQKRIDRTQGRLVESGIREAQQFNPDTYQQQYQPQFEAGMQRAYDTIYGQFERKNQERFAREQQQLQQSLVERGLDPSGEAYQAQTRQLAEQQNMARQDAQNAAWQAAQAYQEQGYQQATGAAMLPHQIRAPYMDLHGQQRQQQWTAAEAAAQRKWEAQQAELQRKHQMALANRAGGGGGGGAPRDPYVDYVMSQYGPPGGGSGGPNTGNAFVTGVGAGLGQSIVNQQKKQ